MPESEVSFAISPDMESTDRVLLLEYSKGNLSLVCAMLNFVWDWAKKCDYKDITVRNVPGGYRIEAARNLD